MITILSPLDSVILRLRWRKVVRLGLLVRIKATSALAPTVCLVVNNSVTKSGPVSNRMPMYSSIPKGLTAPSSACYSNCQMVSAFDLNWSPELDGKRKRHYSSSEVMLMIFFLSFAFSESFF